MMRFFMVGYMRNSARFHVGWGALILMLYGAASLIVDLIEWMT